MIRRSCRGRLSQIIRAEYAGAIFAVSSGIVLFALIFLWQRSGNTLVVPSTAARWLLRFTYLLSLAGFFWGTRALGQFDPFGLRPISLGLRGRKLQPMPFVLRGPYRWVRHPLYLFMLLLIWSCADLTSDRLLFNVLWTIWILIGTRLEERDLVADFGDTYRAYQQRVPMLIPRSARPVNQVAASM
jgi:protein-S-isoprenylcysteine O-methyltransferase Ste14